MGDIDKLREDAQRIAGATDDMSQPERAALITRREPPQLAIYRPSISIPRRSRPDMGRRNWGLTRD